MLLLLVVVQFAYMHFPFPSTSVPYFLILMFIIKHTVIPVDFDGGKSHGRRIKNSAKSAKNLEKSANPVLKSKDF